MKYKFKFKFCLRELLELIYHFESFISKDFSQFQWKSAHAPKKELPKDFL